jgi:hypothetical protein
MWLIGSVLAAAVAALSCLSWWLLRARRMPLGNFVGVIGLAVWIVSLGIAHLFDTSVTDRSDVARALPQSLAWPVPAKSPLVGPTVAQNTQAGGDHVGSVESMIGGLEARLAAQPNDANGWALLAQSYAYTADDAAVERATKRAIELGVDEQSLRERVMGARRSVHAGQFGADSADR